jgi:hypothetical protein|tara:strand:+ start:3657 stop:4325 length:669 start_codon:yes stop_codon:yes gene_type:complete
MIKEISKSIENVVNSLDNTIEGKYNAANDVIDSCDTKWARAGKPISNDANDYILTEVDTDEYFKIGDNQLSGLFYIQRPYFLGGTRIAANREWTISTPKLMEKTPIIWLLHDINYKVYGKNDTRDWESALRIFFLDETNIVNYHTKDHTENVVIPMTKLATEFVEKIESDRSFETLLEWEILNFTRFGTENVSGSFQNILDANLSGVELRITLSKYKENCKC